MPNLTLPLSLVMVLALLGCSKQESRSAPEAPPAAPEEPAAQPQGTGAEDDPVRIPHAPGEMTVDGDAADWAGVAPVPVPYMDQDAGPLRLAWSERGLFGLAEVTDDDIQVDAFNPWGGDCVEIFVEKDFARAMERTDNAAQYAFAPDPDAEGKCVAVIPYGGPADWEDELVSAWKPTETGYVVEFLIPADLLAPAAMEAGTMMGLNFAIDNGGVAVVQFYTDKDQDEAYRKPSLWGAVVLAE